MTSDFAYFVFCLVAVVVGLFIMKKITGCIIRTIVVVVVVALLAAIYFLYIRV